MTIVAPTPQVTSTLELTPTVMPTSILRDDLITPDGHPRVGVWLLVMLAVFGGALLMYWAVSRIVSRRWGLRWALCVFLEGLLRYNYLALDFPARPNGLPRQPVRLVCCCLICRGSCWECWARGSGCDRLTNQSRNKLIKKRTAALQARVASGERWSDNPKWVEGAHVVP